MHAMCHFKYDREITLWLSGFMGRALPGACFPEEVAYGIREHMACDAYVYDLDMSIPAPDGTVDIEVRMSVWAGPRPLDDPEPGPEFDDVRATRDVLNERGLHMETRYWDDEKGAWLRVDPEDEGEDA